MPRHNYFSPGEWNFVCDNCGLTYKSGEMLRGFGAAEDAVVCPRCYTPRQPQDFVRVIPDDPSVPVSRIWHEADQGYGVWINNALQIVLWDNGFGPIPWVA